MSLSNLLIILGVTAIFAVLLLACVMRDVLQESSTNNQPKD